MNDIDAHSYPRAWTDTELVDAIEAMANEPIPYGLGAIEAVQQIAALIDAHREGTS